jgi:hypothetical protein
VSGIVGDGSLYTCKHLMRVQRPEECVFCHRDQLLRQIEMDQAAYAGLEAHHRGLEAENERLRALLTQAPIARVTVWNHLPPSVALYTPGLPPGEHDLYLMPDVPQFAEHELNTPKIIDAL